MSKKLLVRQSALLSQRLFSTTTTSFDHDTQSSEARPFSEVPAMPRLKILFGNMPGGKYYGKSFLQMHKLFNAEFGPILKAKGMLGIPPAVLTYDARDFEKAFRNEGTWPFRRNLDSLVYYREKKRPEIYEEYSGLFSSQDEKWHKTRTITNPIMMQPKTMKLYCKQVDEIAKEFVGIMRKLRDERSEMPADFGNFVNAWSLESIAAVALERRLNILSGTSNDPYAQELINSIRVFFEKSFDFDGLPHIWRIYQTKAFKEFLGVYDKMTDIILHYIEEAIERIESAEEALNEEQDGILRKLLKIDKKVAVVMANDMLLAGVDTTATAAINTLYCLAKNQDKQESLREELLKIMPNKDVQLTAESMRNMPYLRAVIKEAFRVMPVVNANVRRLKADTVLSGYKVPAGTDVAMIPLFELTNPKQYPEPEKFIPERWLRETSADSQCPNAKTANPFTFLPFGFGSRMCIGRRLAELELEVLLTNVIRNFRVEWPHDDLQVKSTFINIPISNLKFKVTDV